MFGKKENKKTVKKQNKTVNLNDYFLIPKTLRPEKPEILKGLEIWEKPEDMSEDYKTMVAELSMITLYIANKMNSGPEVKESVSKRLITARTLINILLNNVFLDTFQKAGILAELQNDLILKGKILDIKMPNVINKNKQCDNKNKEKGGTYIS